jgi:hypothetical protein
LEDRHIDGIRYKYDSEYGSKSMAEKHADRLRAKGEHVRIFHGTRHRGLYHSVVYKIYVKR